MPDEKFSRVFYYGCSMTRVFTPGDILFCEPVSFDAVEPGDIICIERHDGSRQIVHRVVRRVASPPALITRGDNRDTDDAPVASDCTLLRVVLVSRKNAPSTVREPVSHGKDGLLQFRRNQHRMKLKSSFCAVMRHFWFLAFWRKKLCVDPVPFRGQLWFFDGARPVARFLDGRISYPSLKDKLLYQVVLPPSLSSPEKD